MNSGVPKHFEMPKRHRAAVGSCELLDVTLRDGGFAVNFSWPESFPERFARELTKLPIAMVELGYIGGIPELHGMRAAGTAADLSADAVARCVAQGCPAIAMIHPSAVTGRIDFNRYVNAGLKMVRLVYHESWRERVADLAAEAHSSGLKVSVNIALASRYEPETLLVEARNAATEAIADVIYIADTCGALYPDQVEHVVRALSTSLPTVRIGFHAHNFLSLAFANSIAAARAGASFVDASILGLGRSTGNLQTELWVLTTQCHGRTDLRALAAAMRLVESVPREQAETIVAIVTAALNLTPPEEQKILDVARTQSRVAAHVALALASLGELSGNTLNEELLLDALREGDW